MATKGTALDSIGNRARNEKGYAVRNPKTGETKVTKNPPATSSDWVIFGRKIVPKPPKVPVTAKQAALARSATRKQHRSQGR